jgi:hypothetical protein
MEESKPKSQNQTQNYPKHPNPKLTQIPKLKSFGNGTCLDEVRKYSK